MKKIGLEKANLETCVSQARRERLVITRKGKPAALLVSVEGVDMGTSAI
jgi:PHD/YefM family antitoxin component YafN of YafNO toxin-antitoxin module